MTLKVTEKKDLLNDLVRNLSNPEGNTALVGIHGDADSEVLEYAVKNEFGTKNIPARPFIRQTFDKFKEDIITRGLELFVFVRDKKLTKKQALFAWGEFYKDLVQGQINEGTNFVPNAPSTLKAKGGNKHPLQDQGRLQQSIKTVVK